MMRIAKTMIITTMAKTDRHASENNDNDDVDDGMSTMESSPTVALVCQLLLQCQERPRSSTAARGSGGRALWRWREVRV